jgi:hypothetical protein
MDTEKSIYALRGPAKYYIGLEESQRGCIVASQGIRRDVA